MDCPSCPAESEEPCYAVVGDDDVEYRDPCPERLAASKELIYYGVVGKDGELVIADSTPWCLTTYKPAANSAITFVDRDGRNGSSVRRQGPLKIKRFKIVPA